MTKSIPFLLTLFTGFLLSVGIEYLQYALCRGNAEADDVMFNTLGTFLGTGYLLAEKVWNRVIQRKSLRV